MEFQKEIFGIGIASIWKKGAKRFWWNAVAAVVAVALLLPVVHRLATYQPK